MNKTFGTIMVLALGALAFLYFGGSFSASEPTNVPNVPAPDANDLADKARRGGDSAADYVMGLSPGTWKILIIGTLALILTTLFFTRPKFRWALIGGFIVVMVILIFV